MTGNDTIAAVSTAPGEGGIGIIRISGDRAAEILGKIFEAPRGLGPGANAGFAPGQTELGGAPGQTVFADKTMYYGHVVDPSSGETVDEALVVFMEGPRSYTGEDVCEIQCHGGVVPLRRILDIVCGLGASPAQPGEFTKRAFLNGRLDLVQAGAIIDLIKSRTARGYLAAKDQAEGKLSERVRAVRETLLGVLAEIAVRIDYPEAFEEDGTDGAGFSIAGSMEKAEGLIEEMIAGADAGRLVRDGARVVIIGKPNTGKSSLFNALVRENAAIVTPVPGTTRDALEVWIDVKGTPILLTDTAGIRKSEDDIEALGVERAKEQYLKADVSIFLLDGSEELSEEDFSIATELDSEKKLIVVINKSDLPPAFVPEEGRKIIPFSFGENNVIKTSLIGDEASDGIEKIETLLEEIVIGGAVAGSSLLVTKASHKVLLEKASAEIREAREAVSRGEASEFAEINIRAAWNALGEMIGETASDDVIDRVFEDFCVGK